MPKASGKKISDEAVKKATGKTLAEWFRVMDKFGAAKMTHSEIAKGLSKTLKKGWWTQMVTVSYEQARGLREVGQKSDGYAVDAQKIFPLSTKKAWDLITSEAGTKIWLGPALDIEFKPGQIFELSKGQVGEMRVIKPLDRIRFKWHEHKSAKGSVVQITFLPQDKKTAIHFSQEKLSSAKDRLKMKRHWTTVLEELYALVRGVD